MPSVLVVHKPDSVLADVVKTARDFARQAHPDVDEASWRARAPHREYIVEADDVYDALAYTVFEWDD